MYKLSYMFIGDSQYTMGFPPISNYQTSLIDSVFLYEPLIDEN